MLALLLPIVGAAAPESTTYIDWTAEPSEPAALTSSRLVSFNYDWHPPKEGPTWG